MPIFDELPNELLSTILRLVPPLYQCGAYTDITAHLDIAHRHQSAVQALVLVSQHWKNVAYSIDSLWSIIAVMRNDETDTVQHRLTRAGSSPLQLIIQAARPLSITSERSAYARNLDGVMSCSSQWSSLAVDVTFNTHERNLQSLLPRDGPNLEHVFVHGFHNKEHLYKLFGRLQNYPRLMRLTVMGHSPTLDTPTFGPIADIATFDCLKELVVANCGVSSILHALRCVRSTSLETIVLQSIKGAVHPPIFNLVSSYRLPSLRALRSNRSTMQAFAILYQMCCCTEAGVRRDPPIVAEVDHETATSFTNAVWGETVGDLGEYTRMLQELGEVIWLPSSEEMTQLVRYGNPA